MSKYLGIAFPLAPDTWHLIPIFPAPGHSRNFCSKAGSEAIAPKPCVHLSTLPIFRPLQRRKLSRKGETGKRRAWWAKGTPGKNGSGTKSKASRFGLRRQRWGLLGKQPKEFPLQSREGNLSRRLARIHQKVPPARKIRPIQPEHFAHSSAQAIALHGIPQAHRRGDSQA